MAVVQTSRRLQARIMETIKSHDSRDEGGGCIFAPYVTFHNPSDGWKLGLQYPEKFVALKISQDFVNNLADAVTADVEVKVSTYKEMRRHLTDLEMVIVLKPSDGKGTLILTEDPITLRYDVVLGDQEDMDKTAAAGLYPENLNDVSNPSQQMPLKQLKMDLLTKGTRTFRNGSCPATTLRGSTTEFILKWAAQTLGASTVKMAPTDNKSCPDNFPIPYQVTKPEDFFSFIQKDVNVYSKGLGAYYTNDTMYYFKLYETEKEGSPPNTSVLHIINGANTQYIGQDHYHCKVGQDLMILSLTTPTQETLNALDAENQGTSFTMFNSGGQIDGRASVSKDGKKTLDPGAIVLETQCVGASSSTANRMFHNGTSADVYSATTALAKHDGSAMSATWQRAIPGSLEPGQHVVYHFDGQNGEYKTSQGILHGVMYQSTILGMEKNKPLIYFVAALKFFIEPENASAET